MPCSSVGCSSTSARAPDFGQYLGVKGQEFATYENNKVTERIPFYKVDQIVLGSGHCVSTSALLCASMYGIDVLLVGKTGRPLSVMLPFSTDKRVKTRIKQYEAYHNHKGVVIAKEILKARISSQIDLLEKYGFSSSRLKHYLNSITVEGEKVDKIRWNLTGLEGKCTELYLKQYITLFPKYLQPEKRKKYRAKAPLNNLLNLGYEILKGEVYKAVLNAHLDPYLGARAKSTITPWVCLEPTMLANLKIQDLKPKMLEKEHINPSHPSLDAPYREIGMSGP